MIIDDEIIRVQYESTAESPIIVGDVLPVPYRFTEKEQLNAVLSNGTNLVYKQDYTVGETSITLSVDIPIGDTITIYRSTPLDQCSEFPQEAKFNSKKIEDALDKLTMQNQEQREALSRALKLPLTASTDISDLSLPSPVPNKAVKWNSDGTALVNTDFDSDLALVLTEQYKSQAQQAAVEAENQQNIATEQAGIAADKANASANSATQAAETLAAAVTTIATEKEEAIEAVQNQQVNSINAVKSQQNTSIDAVKAQQNTSVNAVKAEGTTQVNLAKAEVTKATTQANNAKTSATNAQTYATQAQTTLNNATTTINTEKTNAVNAVKTQQSTAISAVQNQQTSAVNAVKSQQTSSVNTVKSTGQSYIDKCKAWASSDRIVEGGLYSAKHYAEMAQGKSDVTYEHLRASRVYNDKGMLLTDEEGYAEVAEMNRSTFDLSKFTVVGSPTITEDGVASGFSSGNYIKIPKIDISKGFVIQEKFRCSSIKGSATLFSYTVGETSETRFGIIVYFENNGQITVNSTSDGVSFAGGITTKTAIVANNDYIIKLIYNGSTLSVYLSQDEGKTFTLENSKEIILYNQLEVLKLGINAVNTSAGVFNTGSIDLKQFSITVDGREVFNGNKTGLDVIKKNNCSVAGSLVISEDGVASGFKNGTNYLRTSIKTTDLLNHSWEIVSNIIASTCTSAFTLWKFSNPTSQAGAEGWSSCTFNPNNNQMIFWYKTGDSNESSAQLYKTINIANYLNERIYISYAYNHNTGIYTFKAYLENGTVIGTLNYTATTTNKQLYYINTESNFIISIGTTSSGTLDVGGNIDLNAFKIYIDGQLVYQPCLKIPYNLSKNGAKVVPAYARDRVLDVYENHDKGYAYYTIDEENKNFTLPLGTTFDNSLRRNLENITENGNEKLATSLMYETGSVSNDEKGYKQLEKMNRSTFDLSKFTVVGSPTISEDGVASGFSASNCVKTKTFSTLGKFKIKIKGLNTTLSSQNTSFMRLVHSSNSSSWIVFYIEANTKKIVCVSNGEIYGCNLIPVGVGNNVDFEVIGDGINFIFNIYENGELTATRTEPQSKFSNYIASSDYFLYVGTGVNINYYLGSIDLSQFSITVDGKEVFNGNKSGLDVFKEDNFEVVGSPVISEDGIVSGFSDNNYLTYNAGNLAFNTFEFISPDIYTESVNSKYVYLGSATAGSCNIVISDNDFYIYWINNGQKYKRWAFGNYVNHNIRLKLLVKGTSATVYRSIDGGQFTQIGTTEEIGYSKINCAGIFGKHNVSGNAFNGSIDLNSCKIYVDDNLVYQPCLKIPYNVSKTGSKIVPAYARDRVIDLYEQEGHAGYYTIDEEKKNFTLPMGEIFGLIGQRSLRSVTRDGANYCEIYSDKTIEQGGTCTANVEVTLQQPFADTNYVLSIPYSSKTATSFTPTQTGDWIAKGKGV